MEKILRKKINETYKYSLKVINYGINWNTYIDSGLFLYEDGLTKRLLFLVVDLLLLWEV